MIQFQVGMDASKLVSGNSQVKQEINSTGKLMEDVFGRKLKQVISVVAIEQAVQRTADWAQQIEQASKNLGTTAEQLQTLNHIASATGTAESAVTGLFNNIQKSAQDAIKGNGDLIASFAKLGLSVGDLMNMSNADIFSKIVTSIPKDIRTTSDQYMRQSVQNITGTPENTLMSIQAGYANIPGKGLTDKSNKLSEGGDIAKNADIQQLSAVWSEILTSLKEAGVALLPVATLLLSIVKLFADALGGVANIVSGLTDALSGNFKSALQKVLGTALNALLGLVGLIPKAVGGLVELVGYAISKIPGLGKAGNKIINVGQTIDEIGSNTDAVNDMLGINKSVANKGNAVGQVAAMIGTAGTGAVAGAGAYGARGVAAVTSKIGLRSVSEGAGGLAAKLDKVVEAKGGLIFKGIDELNDEKAASADDLRKFMENRKNAKQKVLDKHDLKEYHLYDSRGNMKVSGYIKRGKSGENNVLGADAKAEIEKEIKAGQRESIVNAARINTATLSKVTGLGFAFGFGVMDQMNKAANNPNNVGSQDIKPIGMPLSFQQMAGGSANLKMGGMFGTGSLMDKLVSLNQKMAENLGTIAKNTSHGKTGGINDAITKHTKQLQSHGYMPGGGNFGGAGAGGQ